VAPVPAITDAARVLRLEHGVDSVDAIHAATAQYAGADVFMSSDKRLVAKLKDHLSLEVAEPYWYGPVPLL
jgi:predicted nucleic acid-binding protein